MNDERASAPDGDENIGEYVPITPAEHRTLSDRVRYKPLNRRAIEAACRKFPREVINNVMEELDQVESVLNSVGRLMGDAMSSHSELCWSGMRLIMDSASYIACVADHPDLLFPRRGKSKPLQQGRIILGKMLAEKIEEEGVDTSEADAAGIDLADVNTVYNELSQHVHGSRRMAALFIYKPGKDGKMKKVYSRQRPTWDAKEIELTASCVFGVLAAAHIAFDYLVARMEGEPSRLLLPERESGGDGEV